MTRRRYVKTAVPLDEYAALSIRADQEGLTLAAYVRAALARDAERQTVAQTLEAFRASLPTGDASAPATSPAGTTPDLVEVLQLVRLLASQANPQAAARITAAINSQRNPS
ncbi:MAG TPA: hypothetical protein VF816_09730 [Rhodocyclaceae bacterium]